MKKKEGFLLIDMIVSLSLYTIIILSLIILLNKNMFHTRNLYSYQEEIRIIQNIENIVRRDIYIDKDILINKKYRLIMEKNILYLENDLRRESLGKIKFLGDKDITNIVVKNSKVFLKEKLIGKTWILSFEIKNNIRTYLVEETYEK